MNIAIIGTGYVGLVSGACFADAGHSVICVDTDANKIEKLKSGNIPIYEPGLAEIVRHNCEGGRLSFTTEISKALDKIQICIIAVGTPMGDDGSADLHYVLNVAHEIGANMRSELIIVDKSTVPIGTAKKVADAVSEELEHRGCTLDFEVVSNPEFLKEGSAVSDCLNPDRIVLGVSSQKAEDVMRELYAPLCSGEKIIVMDVASAEMTKYLRQKSALSTKYPASASLREQM